MALKMIGKFRSYKRLGRGQTEFYGGGGGERNEMSLVLMGCVLKVDWK